MDVNEELKFLRKLKTKSWWGGGVGGQVGGRGVGGVQVGCERNVGGRG